MSLNYKEIELIVSELPLAQSLIQKVHQIKFNTLIFELYSKESGFWELYVEIGKPSSTLYRLSGPPRALKGKKHAKLQRFIQYIRAHIEGSQIESYYQVTEDRILVWNLSRRGETKYLVFRLFSGPKANVIICDENMVIEELLFRRPNIGDVKGSTLVLASQNKNSKEFSVRPYPPESSFNAFIENYYKNISSEKEVQLLESLIDKFAADLNRKREKVLANQLTIQQTSNYHIYKSSGDLLNSYRYLVKEGDDKVVIDMGEDKTTILLNPKYSLNENVDNYYKKYRKEKERHLRVTQDNKDLEAEIAKESIKIDEYYKVLDSSDEKAKQELQRELEKKFTKVEKEKTSVGLTFKSTIFTLLVGRNSKENDQLLRKSVRGNDWWLHLRDHPGAYVFIKNIPNKSVPKETIIDAANLAIFYSKGSKGVTYDLYYTQVKYLKRVKGDKIDEKLLNRLFATKG